MILFKIKIQLELQAEYTTMVSWLLYNCFLFKSNDKQIYKIPIYNQNVTQHYIKSIAMNIKMMIFGNVNIKTFNF